MSEYLPDETPNGFDEEEFEMPEGAVDGEGEEEEALGGAADSDEEEQELQDKIALWKNQFPELFSTVLDDQLYIWRPLTREEYKNMVRRGITEENAQHELVSETCVLWPENYGSLIATEPAGVPSTLAKGIMNTSGFSVTLEPLAVHLLSEEDIETLDEGLQRVIPAALMQFPKRVYLSIIGNRQFLWRVLTRKEYRELRNTSGSNVDLFWMEEKLFRKCVLWPTNDLRSLIKDYAGYGTTVAEQVTFQSGFGSEAEIKKL